MVSSFVGLKCIGDTEEDRRMHELCQIKCLWAAVRRQSYYELCKSLSVSQLPKRDL